MTTAVELHLKSFAETVWLNKGRAYFVGGTTRDRILGVDVKDIDVEVHGIEPKDLKVIVQSHFKDVKEMGTAFGVLHTHIEEFEVDISLPRRDSKIGAGHKGFDVNVDPFMNVEDALRRRDFTINAMLEDILDGTIHDPFGGRQDIIDRILRVVDQKTFIDDPLRVLRGVQLAGRLELDVDTKTKELMTAMSPQLSELSIDRKRTEWRKLFLMSHKPSIGLNLAYSVGVFKQDIELVEKMVNTEQEHEWHPEGNVWLHTMMVVDQASLIAERERLDEIDRMILMLGSFCHDIGKPETTRVIDGRIRTLGHAEAGIRHVKDVLGAMGLSHFVKHVKPLVQYHMIPNRWWAKRDGEDAVNDGEFRQLARNLKPSTMELLAWVADSDSRGRGPFPGGVGGKDPAATLWFLERATELGIKNSQPHDVVSGRDLIRMGFSPGPHFGIVIKAVNKLHDEYNLNRDQIIERILKKPNVVGVESVDLIVDQLK